MDDSSILSYGNWAITHGTYLKILLLFISNAYDFSLPVCLIMIMGGGGGRGVLKG